MSTLEKLREIHRIATWALAVEPDIESAPHAEALKKIYDVLKPQEKNNVRTEQSHENPVEQRGKLRR